MKGSEYCPAHKLKKYISGNIGVLFYIMLPPWGVGKDEGDKKFQGDSGRGEKCL